MTVTNKCGYFALTFYEVNLQRVAMNDICRLIRDTDILIDITEQCNDALHSTQKCLEEVRNVLSLIKTKMPLNRENEIVDVIDVDSDDGNQGVKTSPNDPNDNNHEYIVTISSKGEDSESIENPDDSVRN